MFLIGMSYFSTLEYDALHKTRGYQPKVSIYQWEATVFRNENTT